MVRAPNLRDSDVTTGSMVAARHGLRIYCCCGNQGMLTPKQIAQAPDTQIYDYKSRFRCTRCGRRGEVDEIEVRVFVETAPFSPEFVAKRNGTPPQQWAK